MRTRSFTREQLKNFGALIRELRRQVPGKYKVHVLQTAGLLGFAQEPFEIVRPGLMLYGISPLPEFQRELQPVMTWKTRIALIRECRLVTASARSHFSYAATDARRHSCGWLR